MATLGCELFMTGLMFCANGTVLETYVAGDTPQMFMETRAFIMDAAKHHQAVWGSLTDDKLDAAFADWGPRRKIDWSKITVKAWKP